MYLGDNPHFSSCNFLLSPHWVHIVYFERSISTTFYSELEPLINCHTSLKFDDPKVDNYIFRKDLFKDQLSSYLLDCRQYLDIPKDCITTCKVAFHTKIEPEFQSILEASITIHIKAFKKKVTLLSLLEISALPPRCLLYCFLASTYPSPSYKQVQVFPMHCPLHQIHSLANSLVRLTCLFFRHLKSEQVITLLVKSCFEIFIHWVYRPWIVSRWLSQIVLETLV